MGAMKRCVYLSREYLPYSDASLAKGVRYALYGHAASVHVDGQTEAVQGPPHYHVDSIRDNIRKIYRTFGMSHLACSLLYAFPSIVITSTARSQTATCDGSAC